MINRIIRRRALPAAITACPAQLHPLVARLYAARGVRSAQELQLSLDQLIPIGQLGGIVAAVELLCRHRAARSGIIVIGDFDADGATATALVVRQLRRLGFANVDFIVPNRFAFGYGLTPEIVRVAAARAPGLIITVDNGISSHAGVMLASSLGIDTLLTDHHLPGTAVPAATVIVNPNACGDSFASKALAGVGVAFYVMAALTRELKQQGLVSEPPPITDLLDLVALGTVADLVPLDRNNRILVQQGLRRIRAGKCLPGVRALLDLANRPYHDAIAADLGYQLGPRLNAAGRLDDMSIGIQCLLCDELTQARALAGQLTQLNVDRQELEQQMQRQALEAVEHMSEAQALPLGLCLFDESWHQGVVGLVASRVKDRVHRPVIALARADAQSLKGSARSVDGVHIRDVLAAIASREPDLLEKFGGHAMAAGLSLPAAHLARLSAAFDAEVCRWLSPEDTQGVVHSDGELAPEQLTLELAHVLRSSGPWGQMFPEPLFDGHFAVRGVKVLGERHLRLEVQQGKGCYEAIAFRHFDDEAAPVVAADARVELAYRLDVNRYQGLERLQLVVEHLRVL
jgi:single-stranded-DNA-specific exonuclease